MRNFLRLVGTSALLGYRALFAWNTPGLFVTTLVLTPLLQVAFFVILGGSLHYHDPSFFVIGNSIQVASAAGISGLVSVVADERRFGTLSHILASPAPRVAVFLGRTLPGVVLGAAVSIFTSAVGFAFLGWPITGAALWVFLLAILAASFSSAAFGLFLSALGLVYRDIYQIASAAYLLLLIVSGANIAREDLPAWLRVIGDALPEAHSIAAARSLVAGSATSATWLDLGFELLVGVVWLALSLAGLRVLEVQAQRRSTLELY
jgi:ABC-2 type transport system permease protein